MAKLLFLTIFFISPNIYSFCGFFVSKGGASLFNKASQVVVMRDKERTVLTMANDYKGPHEDFALVVPVPSLLKKEQINIGNRRVIDHIDTYTAPRLVEYFDPNPCQQRFAMESMGASPRSMMMKSASRKGRKKAKDFGVKIEAKYTVGEYDISILSAKKSKGLYGYLQQEKYKLPKGAEKILNSYLKQGLLFFVAKVNIKEQLKSGFTNLRPIQMAYNSKRFMLPIRLGTLNSEKFQDLFVYFLTRTGRVESTNYRTVKIPSNIEIPPYTKSDFESVYKDIFSTASKKENLKALFLEYAWDMAWCDPCAADPLSPKDLRSLGAFWINKNSPGQVRSRPGIMPRRPMPRASNVFVTRLHARYTKETFPSDIFFQVTNDRKNFQGRYILRHPWTGNEQCEAAANYRKDLPHKKEKWAQNLSRITGRDIGNIRKKLEIKNSNIKQESNTDRLKLWWRDLWGK